MRRLFLAAGLAAMAIALAMALCTPTSHAGPPPIIYFGSWFSATPPVAGRTFTPVLVGHNRFESASWTLSCSVSVHGQSIAAHPRHFHQRPAGWDRRSCSVYVPRRAVGSTLAVTVTASDSDAHTFDATRGWRVRSNASMTTVPLGLATGRFPDQVLFGYATGPRSRLLSGLRVTRNRRAVDFQMFRHPPRSPNRRAPSRIRRPHVSAGYTNV